MNVSSRWMACFQWLSCKKKWWNAPLHSPFLPSSLAAKRPSEDYSYGVCGERCQLLRWGLERIPGRKRILLYFELENCTWRRHFWLFILAWNGAFYKRPRKKTSCIGKKYTNGVPKNYSGTWWFRRVSAQFISTARFLKLHAVPKQQQQCKPRVVHRLHASRFLSFAAVRSSVKLRRYSRTVNVMYIRGRLNLFRLVPLLKINTSLAYV